ncbi:dihydroneopterin aldolase [Sphingomonas sp. ID0503]|uniref:dihydroneopterin aldolase n=1 Tax=Sphingomonas sp. ID0503 TaxID=3399691 RepID=UPI003AFA3933
MTNPRPIDGPLPDTLRPGSFRIFLENYDLPVDIGFHDFEIGTPQRLLVSVEVWVTEDAFAAEDSRAAAWNYDFLRTEIGRLAAGRRFNLQETFVREIYALLAGREGVLALRIKTSKPDVYPDCEGVGVEMASFAGPVPTL